MGGVGISSTPSLQQSSDLEKTQAELRQTFTAAEKFRRELEFLQKGGDPLDLKPGNATSISTESSGRLGAPLVCEPNSADNLMLLKEANDSVVLEFPKKSYKRRIRSRPNRDGAPSRGAHFLPFRHASNSKPKSPNADVALKNTVSHLERELDGMPAVQSTLGPTHGPHSDGVDAPLTTDSVGPESIGCMVIKSVADPTKVLDAESACTQISQRVDQCNGSAIKEEEGLKGSESIKGVGSDGCTDLKIEKNSGIVAGPTSADVAEQNACSQDNVKLDTKEREDAVLEEARMIEAKRKRISELSVRTLPLERRLKSHWDFVLEEMSWLANDFAQERLWKVTASAQISQRVAFASRIRFQQQRSLQKQMEVSHTLAETVMQFWHTIQVKYKGPDHKKDDAVGIEGYAMSFMEYNNSSEAQCNTTQIPATPDTISDLAIMDRSWEDNLTEENLFYTVPPGAIEAYRKAIDSHLLQFEKTGSRMQEEVDTSCYDAIADNTFEEDEGETNTYYLPKTAQKRRQNFKLYGPRSYEMGDELTFGSQPSGKRPGSSLNVAIPTKRVRTASRQRIISPFNAGTSGQLQPNRTDASSGDNNSFQDEQSSLHGGPRIPNNMEAESVGEYEKQLQFDSMEASNRPKKRKKAKHPGSTFEHRWQLDSNFQNDQKDHSRRRLDAHQFDSNGSSVASQMSNMSNPNKIMKLLVRDRSRKVKALKTPVGQPGSGSPWSLFEDQALVVLVHDMGPNWELISDAINNTLQFKSIFRKSKECKERHKILMDGNTGDGADSADDSGSSQPYPSTLPGIPEGSARQLFQRLQGPMEEDTLKTHFEKIIMIGQKQHYRRTQNDSQDLKQLQQSHSSHVFALSQVCPNNLNGGPVLTPLELSDAVSSGPEVLPVGYQGPHSSGLPVLNHGSSGPTSSAPGSSGSIHGTNLPSTSAPLNPPVREGRHGTPRAAGSLSVDEQQRMQQYNQMLSARNGQQSSLPPGSHSVTDRGVRILPAGINNRNMKMVRPGYQGIASPSMHPGPGPGQGNSMLRPRDPMHMTRPNQNTDLQVSQNGPTQGVPAFASSSFPNQISQPPVQSYPRPISPQQSPHMLSGNPHHPRHFQTPPNHANPAYAIRLAKERQLQQQRLLQQQFSTSNPVMPRVQSPPHGIVRNPQTSGNQMAKQQRQRPAQQFQPRQQTPPQQQAPPQQQQTKVMKNGLQSGSSTGKQSVLPRSSLSQPHPQKTFSGQTQPVSSKKPSDSSENHAPSAVASTTNRQPENQKLANQKQATTHQKVLTNLKVNTSDQPTATSSTNTPCNDANSTANPVVSSIAPQTSGAGTESEPSGPAINQTMVSKESSSDSLPNPGGNDEGVQWQQQPAS